MGFTTGFLGGLTLTYSLLYMSLYVHRANRNVQKTLLSQQTTLLNSVVEPLPPLPDPPAYEVRKAGLVEELKDHWNSEVEHLVRKVQTTDWDEQREIWEARISAAWAKLRSTESAHQLEAKAKEVEQQVVDAARDGTQRALASAKETSQKVQDTVKSEAGKASAFATSKAKEVGQKVRESVAEGADKAKNTIAESTEKAKATTKDVADKATGREPRLLELK
ncbi:hypothetical protein EDD36DRAFT_463927 [Exophiala viscosa]|uniref:MICOS complex subunit MIC12 n=1 Tax=Exophiala viscosa TaxID=2486360 RepID=A0AAN6DXK6_9EURO|nr:hypothetical protein EDD36DRAFT_463927 [Exophiala viscosa]